MASPLNHNPKYHNYWTKETHDRFFEAIPDALSSKCYIFSVGHPVYDDQIMNRALRHAMYSAMANKTEPPSCPFHVGEYE